jgi:tRNA threonylcarbamoyladenosine modification (KEOPS) complex Cgi121 subunit
MTSFTFELFPHSTLHMALFSEVTNAAELKAALPHFDCALMSTELLASIQHVLCAANRALFNEFRGERKTKTIYSDLIYYLSPTTNIKDSLQRWGIHLDSTSVLAVSFSEEGLAQVCKAVEGRQEPIRKLSEFSDLKKVAEAFEVGDEELQSDLSLTAAVYTRIALKDYKKS